MLLFTNLTSFFVKCYTLKVYLCLKIYAFIFKWNATWFDILLPKQMYRTVLDNHITHCLILCKKFVWIIWYFFCFTGVVLIWKCVRDQELYVRTYLTNGVGWGEFHKSRPYRSQVSYKSSMLCPCWFHLMTAQLASNESIRSDKLIFLKEKLLSFCFVMIVYIDLYFTFDFNWIDYNWCWYLWLWICG